MKNPRQDATGRRMRRAARAAAQARGAAMTEYTVIVGLVALACIGAFLTLGVALVVSFEARRDLILYPFP